MHALVTLLSLVAVTADSDQYPRPKLAESARTELATALEQLEDPALSRAAQLSQLRTAATQVADRLEPHSPIAEALQSAVKASQMGDRPLETLRTAVEAAAEDLAFEPLAEAELPEGFPTYTPVGTIQVKQYPKYRMASGPGFGTLFMHITLNRIAMTAPVEMTYKQNESGKWTEQQMAFLYQDPAIGQAGKKGKVTVQDVEQATFVSIGLRGARTSETVQDASRRLQQWLAASSQYQADGPMRVMGYNSPYVPSSKNYFEVQIPISSKSNPDENPGR